MQKNNLTTLKALTWSTLGSLLPTLISPVLAIFIASLLDPKAYGVVAVAIIIISFLNIFLASGFTSALIQKIGTINEIHETADFVFTFNIILSTVLYFIVFILADYLALFFKCPESNSIIRVLSLNLIIQAVGNVHSAMLQKEMNFKALFWRQIAPISIQLLITLPFALLGYGVWALVFGQLLSNCVAVVTLWINSEWKPKINLSFEKQLEILKFGLYVISSAFLGWMLTQGDNIIVGRFLSVQELGLYKTGYDFDQRIFGLIITPIIPVFYAKFCQLQQEDRIFSYYKKIKIYLSIVIFPVLFSLILFSPYFEKLVLGRKWAGIGFVMSILSVTGLGNLWALFDGLYKSIGKPNISIKITLINIIVYIPLWLFFVQFGLRVFLISRLFMVLFALCLNTYFECSILHIGIIEAAGFYFKAFISSVTVFLFAYGVQLCFFKENYGFIPLISLLIICCLTYITMLRFTTPFHFNVLKNIILRKPIAEI